MKLEIKPKQRNPNRSRPHASITLPWQTYDRIDAIAVKHNATLPETLNALLDAHEKTLAKK